MDLLGSIMSSMDKPPTSALSEEQKKRLKEQKLNQETLKKQQDQQISNFRQEMKTKMASFIKDQKLTKITMSPMPDVYRALLHQMAEDAGLVSYSLGADGVHRHLVIWKKEYTPCDDELTVLRDGEVWSKEKAEELKLSREAQRLEASRPAAKVTPKSDYLTKYTHIIDVNVGRNGAHDVTAKSQYGNVHLKHKTDKRTIEETLAERRAKKLKMSDAANTEMSDAANTEMSARRANTETVDRDATDRDATLNEHENT